MSFSTLQKGVITMLFYLCAISWSILNYHIIFDLSSYHYNYGIKALLRQPPSAHRKSITKVYCGLCMTPVLLCSYQSISTSFMNDSRIQHPGSSKRTPKTSPHNHSKQTQKLKPEFQN